MTPTRTLLSEQSETPRLPNKLGRWLLVGVCLAALLACAPFLFGTPTGERSLLALCALGGMLILVNFSPTLGIPAVLVWLAVLGGLRRWLIPVFDWVPSDPLLLAAPLLAILYFGTLVASRRVQAQGHLTPLLGVLLGVMVLQILNPGQGGLNIGIAGALFYIIPLLWYFLGNSLGSAALLRRLFVTTIGVSLLAAVYGLHQVWFGYSDSEMQWMNLTGYGALNAGGGTLKAISFFTSCSEYASILALSIVLLWAAFLRGVKLALLPIPLLAVALFLDSIRGPIVGTLVTCTALWAIQGRSLPSWLPRGALALVVAAAGLIWSLGQVQQGQYSAQTSSLVNHQVDGLLNPLDPNKSTAGTHTSMLTNGFVEGLSSPLGHGLGYTTIAGTKFGETTASSEVDFSNMFISLGFIGGVVYIAVFAVAISLAVESWRQERSLETLWALSTLLLSIGGWLSGGQYSTAFLIWFSLGSLNRMKRIADERRYRDAKNHTL